MAPHTTRNHECNKSSRQVKIYWIPLAVKNEAKLTEFINYIGNKESLMTCYSVRAYLKCKVSSNMAEKANDMLVAHRQKKKAMSWSQDGSSGMATLKAFTSCAYSKRVWQVQTLLKEAA